MTVAHPQQGGRESGMIVDVGGYFHRAPRHGNQILVVHERAELHAQSRAAFGRDVNPHHIRAYRLVANELVGAELRFHPGFVNFLFGKPVLGSHGATPGGSTLAMLRVCCVSNCRAHLEPFQSSIFFRNVVKAQRFPKWLTRTKLLYRKSGRTADLRYSALPPAIRPFRALGTYARQYHTITPSQVPAPSTNKAGIPKIITSAAPTIPGVTSDFQPALVVIVHPLSPAPRVCGNPVPRRRRSVVRFSYRAVTHPFFGTAPKILGRAA